MDRLVCGDVGFGKTEVALRAAFVAAMSGMQVAVIAPTTLLARQHFKSFSERFRGMPLQRAPALALRARQGGGRDPRRARRRARSRSSIGTHALLAKQVRFKNLGLLVIDEEQHFGVAHKERLKALRSDVHVLTLTATPIPRTLQLALSGVRELSLIATPPVDRLAIRTYVSEFDPVTVREALLREHYRGGQSFYVVPRIADLPEVEAVPARAGARGQLRRRPRPDGGGRARRADERLLRRQVRRAARRPRIIESGLDIPAANTLIVDRADMFGLAQLYQIRGRVGPLQAARLRLLHDRAAQAADAAGREAAAGCSARSTASAPASRWRARTSTSAAPATCSARSSRATCARSASSSTRTMLEEAIARLAVRRASSCADDGRLVAADQPRRAGADPRGLRPRPRRAPRPLPPAVGARAQGRARGLRRRADRPLRPAAGRGRDAAARRAHQGALQARRHRPARRRPEGRDRPVPQRQVRQPRRAGAVPARPERASPRSATTRSSSAATGTTDKARLKGAFAIARDLAALAKPEKARASA